MCFAHARRPERVYTPRAQSLPVESHPSFCLKPSRGSGVAFGSRAPYGTGRASRCGRASRGGASLRSAWLSSAGAYPIRVWCILAFVDSSLGARTIIFVLFGSYCRSSTTFVVPERSWRSSHCIHGIWELAALKLSHSQPLLHLQCLRGFGAQTIIFVNAWELATLKLLHS